MTNTTRMTTTTRTRAATAIVRVSIARPYSVSLGPRRCRCDRASLRRPAKGPRCPAHRQEREHPLVESNQAAVLQRDGHRCQLCGAPARRSTTSSRSPRAATTTPGTSGGLPRLQRRTALSLKASTASRAPGASGCLRNVIKRRGGGVSGRPLLRMAALKPGAIDLLRSGTALGSRPGGRVALR
jgi:hypothetical protein